MRTFDVAFARLAELTDYERKAPRRPHRFDLDGIAELCAAVGHPERRLGTVVQVGGSKGKGTVTALLAGMGRASGLRAGAYMSPHVVDARERVQVDGRFAPGLAPAIDRVADVVTPRHTWFEAFTAAALLCFAEQETELCVLEVGLGGRLDSTSFVPKHACCITGIELEHTRLLGDTVEAVAGEKCGLLRPGVPCVTGAEGAALAVIEERCRELGSPLAVLGRELGLGITRSARRQLSLRIDLPRAGRLDMVVPLYAAVHGRSFALALALFAEVFPRRAERIAGADPGWVTSAMPPARFQVVRQDPPIVVDGAHTDGSLAALAVDLRDTFPGRRFRLVFSIAAGKRWRNGLGQLLPVVDRAIVAPLRAKAGVPCEELASFFAQAGVPCAVVGSTAEAVAAARADPDDSGLLVTGSLYAAGDALPVLLSETPTD